MGRGSLAARKYIHRLTAGHPLEWEPVGAETWRMRFPWFRDGRNGRKGWTACGIRTPPVTMLTYWEELEGQEFLVRVDGAPGAVMAGYPIGKICLISAWAKQSCYITGMAEYTRHALCSFLPEKYSLVNGEEDLGIEGLRRMKQRMRPVGLLRMYEGRGGCNWNGSMRITLRKKYFGNSSFRPSSPACGLVFGDMMDGIVVGQRMGVTGLAAISLALPSFMVMNVLMHGLGLGGAIRFSGLMAKGKKEEGIRGFQGILSAAP